MTLQAQCSSVRKPDLLQIDCGTAVSYGANQTWYPYWRARLSGCGPTAASNLLWYLTQTRPQQCGALFAGDAGQRSGMVQLMQQVWRYVRPAPWGMARAEEFVRGVYRYAKARGVQLHARVLQVPASPRRPDRAQVYAFLSDALASDLPVAFLNRANGAVDPLPGWHWVTLVSVKPDLQAEMYDQSKSQWIDLERWLSTTSRGGAFVALEPEKR